MVFTSNDFLIFFVACAVGYFLLAPRFRWVLLLVFSYAFYAAGEAQHLVLLVGVTLAAYLAGLLVERCPAGKGRRWLLGLSVAAMLAPLFVYKYLGFVMESAQPFMQQNGQPPSLAFDILLPLGISFFTFQALSYVIDIYRGERQAERHLGMLALFISFFPQLIAGPIERADRLLPQFRQHARFDPDATTSGLRLILWGVFKKLVIADNLAPYVDAVYAEPTAHTGVTLMIATVFFAFQIYCDFSAYVDIARGCARILGIELMQNFDRPYGASSISTFWRRWHISLTTWFRDYVYIPLGGNRRSLAVTSRNIGIVFLLSGLWHGANWTFVVWGALHGLALILWLWSRETRASLAATTGLAHFPRLQEAAGIALTFAFVCFAWIFFRAASLGDAWYVATHLFDKITDEAANGRALAQMIEVSGGSPAEFLALLLAVAGMMVIHVLPERAAHGLLQPQSAVLRWGTYYALALGVLFLSGSGDAFIYFRF